MKKISRIGEPKVNGVQNFKKVFKLGKEPNWIRLRLLTKPTIKILLINS